MKIYINCLKGIVYKELIRFFKQKSRFFSAIVRPLLWLFIFSVGFETAFSFDLIEPYEKNISYSEYIVPGLIAMILLFNGMQSSLTMIFDREMGSMKIMLSSYINRNYLLFCKMFATSVVSTIQALTFLIIAKLSGIDINLVLIIMLIPFIIVSSILLNAFALFLSSVIKELENFASVMNFVIFPMLFLSSALYPLNRLKESSDFLYAISYINPLTSIVELFRFILNYQFSYNYFLVVLAFLSIVLIMAFAGFKLKKVNK